MTPDQATELLSLVKSLQYDIQILKYTTKYLLITIGVVWFLWTVKNGVSNIIKF